MNEVEISEGSVFTYRLSNGTHVLIHQTSPMLQNKEPEVVDCEEAVPLLFLEDGQIYNGSEILQTQLLDSTTEGTSFLLPTSPLEVENDKTDQAPAETDSSKIVAPPPLIYSPQVLEDPSQEKNDKVDKVLEDENMTLDKLEDFVELVTSYRCRICPFTTPDQQELIQHFKLQHVQVKREGSSSNKAQPENILTPPAGDSLDFSSDVLTPATQPVSEKLIFLCGQCSDGFPSLEACKQHMMQDHDMIVLEAPGNSKSSKNGTEDVLIPAQPDSVNVGDGMKQDSVSEIEPVVEKDHPTTGTTTTGKRKVRMPRMLEREYLLSKEPGNTDARPNEVKFKCVERSCQYKFNNEESLQIHMSCHTAATTGGDSKPEDAAATATPRREFACFICGERFERWRGCALHLWKAHEVDAGLLSCPVCQTYKTVTAVKLENHIKIHGETRAYTCPDCGKGFKQSSQLRNHRVMHLDRKSGPVPRWYASKRCDICFKSYADSKCLKKHIQAVHSKLRPYVCQVCGHASARKAMLQMHLRQHTGEKPYGCTLCDYRTGDHNSLRRHTMRHTGQRPYRCPHCDYSAIQSNSYKNHLRSKHPGLQGLFSCTQCSFRTVSQEGFLQHVSDHKYGLITTSNEGEIEVFPGNVAAAHLIYRCLNALSEDGSPLQANVTGSSTSEDGTTQTITIQIPSQQQDGSTGGEGEDEETTPCFLAIQEEEEEGVDTGGITIPAEPDPDPNPSPGIVPGGS